MENPSVILLYENIPNPIIRIMFILTVYGQNNEKLAETKKSRNKKNELRNEVYAAYNFSSVYLTNPYVDHSYTDYPYITNLPKKAVSNRALTIGFNRKFTRVVTIGFMLSYVIFHCTGDYHSTAFGTIYKTKIID